MYLHNYNINVQKDRYVDRYTCLIATDEMQHHKKKNRYLTFQLKNNKLNKNVLWISGTIRCIPT